MTSNDWLAVFGGLGLATLVPVIWAIVDVARRPPWQFSTLRKVVWGLTLGLGWLVLWPVALVSSLLYLFVLRRRLPQVTSSAPRPGRPPYGYGSPPFGAGQHRGPYGSPPYGAGPQQGTQHGPQQGPPAYGNYGYPPNVPPAPTPPLPPAGWYPDPAGSGQQRWWDGRGWTNHLRRAPG